MQMKIKYNYIIEYIPFVLKQGRRERTTLLTEISLFEYPLRETIELSQTPVVQWPARL